MVSQRVGAFIEQLRDTQLLSPEQLAEARKHPLAAGEEPLPLAKDLIIRGWMTGFQAKQLILGRGQDLVFGSYRLQELLGEGGMGQVYRAYHIPMGRTVALKVIRKEHLTSQSAVQRFHREVRAAAQLTHPNIVTAFDAGEVNGSHFFAMEYVEGTDLSKLVKESGPLSPLAACEYIRQAALGLQHAHERGLVHRDIKPANLLVSKTTVTPDTPLGTVKLLDMGLARLAGPDDQASPSVLTRIGTIVGTPEYMAPEQARDPRTADIRADLYSLGCTFFFLLTGQPPFRGQQLSELLIKHQMDVPPSFETYRGDVPANVQAVIRKLMAKRPADRYQVPAELLAALPAVRKKMTPLPVAQLVSITPTGEIAPSSSRRANRRRWTVAALVAVPAVAAVALALALSSGNKSHAKLGAPTQADAGSVSTRSNPPRNTSDSRPTPHRDTKPEPVKPPTGNPAELVGTWKWMVTLGNQPREMTLRLKMDGNNLVGAMPGRDGQERPVEEVRYQDRQLSFKMVRDRKGQKFIVRYEGTFSGDTIKGKIDFNGNNHQPWEARHLKD